MDQEKQINTLRELILELEDLFEFKFKRQRKLKNSIQFSDEDKKMFLEVKETKRFNFLRYKFLIPGLMSTNEYTDPQDVFNEAKFKKDNKIFKNKKKKYKELYISNLMHLQQCLVILGCFCSGVHNVKGQNEHSFFEVGFDRMENKRFRIQFYPKTKYYTLMMLRNAHYTGDFEDVIEPIKNPQLIFNVVSSLKDCNNEQ